MRKPNTSEAAPLSRRTATGRMLRIRAPGVENLAQPRGFTRLKTLGTLACIALLAAFAAEAFAHDGKLTFAPVLEDVTPAVVSIRTTGPQARNPLYNDPFFRRFFDGPRAPQRAMGAGSGVIVDAHKGHVVTNHHVIDNAEEIIVELKDRREFTAELVGSDPETDIALLKIDAEDLEALPLGDSDALSVGDFVIAIGNPFNLGQTVTSGIVSALGRRGGFNPGGYEDFIQTDASINRGNSGGALVDLDGDLVGINSAIITPSGANAGIGFAVPANIVKVVAEQLLEYGDVRRGFLGVNMTPVTSDVADALGLDKAEGVVVGEVVPESGADEAGIEPGDVIVSVDGEEVVDAMGLRTRIGLASVGKKVQIGLVRDGEHETLTATLGEVQRQSAAQPASTPLLDGAAVRDMSPDHELYGKLEGVEVAEVTAGSRAAAAGLRAGDVIVGVNRRRIANISEFEETMEGRAAAGLLVQRGDRRLFTWLR